MEETKTKRIKMSNVICVIAILVIIVLVISLLVTKSSYNKKIANLEENNKKMQRTIDDLNEKIVADEEKEEELENIIANNTVETSSDDETTANTTEVDQIAEELFNKGSQKIREIIYSSYDQYALIIPSEEKTLDKKIYEKRNALYSSIEMEFTNIFTDKALEAALKERFIEADDGFLYVSIGGQDEWNISNVRIERVSETEAIDEIEYKITYNDVELDNSVSEDITCTMKIKLVDGEYRISETNYCELM
ncbi:MAG: hypothetical protein HFJ44_00480 [Clostridia bacterium]|jgi:cell division protein FtsB|nr:hypothetical protein [Clostridia bacterium]